MLSPTSALRFTDDLVARAMTQLDDGERTASRHLLARASREIEAFSNHPSYLTTRTANTEDVGRYAVANIVVGKVELEAGRGNAAYDAMQSARFLLDLLIPG